MQFNIEWIGSIATGLSILGGFVWWAVRGQIDNRHLRRDLEQRDAALASQQKEMHRLADIPQLKARVAELKKRLAKTFAEKEAILAKGDELVEVYRDLRKRSQADLARLGQAKKLAEDEIARLAETNGKFNDRIALLATHIDEMKDQDGRVWQRPVVPDTAPPFRPLAERRFPIISILNLKGGVGKTTITAHLAGALGQKGKKVLMVDLDYQRSLSLMTVASVQRSILSLQGRCLQHFLGGPKHGPKELLGCVHPVGAGMPNCSIITNSDAQDESDTVNSLEETEARLMAEWTVQGKSRDDIRLLLRSGLHAPEMTGKFDYVLFDCPPRLTTACVNALAASDYVLIPVGLDALAAKSSPELLRSLKRLQPCLLPKLAILGVVANMAKLRVGSLVKQETDVWDEIQLGLGSVWEGTIAFFKTMVPDKAQFGLAAGSIDHGGLQLALEDDSIRTCFSHLVAEIEKEIKKHERRNASAIPS